jgi:hypothetical protein
MPKVPRAESPNSANRAREKIDLGVSTSGEFIGRYLVWEKLKCA